MNTARTTSPNLAILDRKIDRRTDGAANLAPGWFLTPEFGSHDGSSTETKVEVHKNEVLQVKKLKYDSIELQKMVVRAINAAHYTMRRYAAPLFAGLHFVPLADFAALDAELQTARDLAHTANQIAKQIRSRRKTRIEIFPFFADASSPRHAMRAGQAIRQRLIDLRETFVADGRNDFLMEWRSAQNLAKVLVGHQHEVVENALKSAQDQRPAMIAQWSEKGGRGDAKARKENKGKVPDLDYREIDAAIALFAPSENAFL